MKKLTLFVTLLIAGCHQTTVSTPPSFTVGGTVSGLESGQEVTLFNNATDALTLTANGNFTFALPIQEGGSYSVTVQTQPTKETCVVNNSSGKNVTGNSTVNVVCSVDTFTVGGVVSGLSGSLTLINSTNSNSITLTTNGDFTFSKDVSYDNSYDVLVSTQPVGQTCAVSSGSGNAIKNVVIDVVCVVNTATLSWVPPVENTDGSTLTDLSGYTIFYGTSSDSLNQTVQITDPTVSTYTIQMLDSGVTYYFSVAANASDGTQSSQSDVVSKSF